MGLLLALLVPIASAGACCVGSTSASPTVLGECEHWAAGLGLGGEVRLGSWDAAGNPIDDSLEERALLGSLGLAWRWNRSGRITADLPLRMTVRSSGAIAERGGGIGDTRLTAIFDPLEEGRLPVPVLRIGARLASGRSWEASESALQSDVTGLEGSALTGGLSLARTLGQVPWSLGLSAEVPIGVAEAPSLVSAAASVGHYLGTNWTVAGSLRHDRSFSGRQSRSYSAARTTAGLQIIRGQRLAWRAWLGGGTDLPLPGLGRSNPIQTTVSAGIVLVR